MNSKTISIALVIVLFLSACDHSLTNVSKDKPNSDIGVNPVPTSRARGSNLDADWNWLPGEDNSSVNLYLNSGERSVDLPYYDPNFSKIDLIASGDVKKSNGWRLYYRNFGTSTHPVTNPVLMLYNKYTATFRVFVYSTNQLENYTNAMVQVSINTIGSYGNGTEMPALFTFKEGLPLEDFTKGANIASTVSRVVNGSWYWFDFTTIGYQPNIDQSKFTDAAFKFDLRGVDITATKSSGEINTQAIYSGGGSNFFSTTSSLLSNLSNNPTAEFFQRLTKDNETGFIHDLADNSSDDSIADTILGLADAGLSELIPGLSGLSKFVGVLFGGNTSPVLTGFKGTVTLKGEESTKKDLLSPPTVRIPNTPESNTAGIAEPLYTNNIGIFNIQDAKWDIVSAERGVEPCRILGRDSRPTCSTSYTIQLNSDTKIQINPVLEEDNNLKITKKLSVNGSPYKTLNDFENNESITFKCRPRYYPYPEGYGCLPRAGLNAKVVIDDKSSGPDFTPKLFTHSYTIPIDWNTIRR